VACDDQQRLLNGIVNFAWHAMAHGIAARVRLTLDQELVKRQCISTLRAENEFLTACHQCQAPSQLLSFRPTMAQAGQKPKRPDMAAIAPAIPTTQPVVVELKYDKDAAIRANPINTLIARSQPGTFLTYNIVNLLF
jgi:hypothetical protein